MNWNEQYSKHTKPDLTQITAFVANPLWEELCTHLEERYGVEPLVEHSICSGAPGWNVKYKKGGRSLCTLYPGEGGFTCLVTIGTREAMEAELLLGGCTDEVRKLYWDVKPMNGARWLMIEVTGPAVLSDVKGLISTRVKSNKAN